MLFPAFGYPPYLRPNVNSTFPATTLTYWFPSTEYVIGPDITDGPIFVCQSSFPSRASRAKKLPSRAPR